ncbi:MFS transporter [Microbacterium gorillae]|uniref:MFS transporter n=1 Tax=Microbacterium gorillae TaxID=1231063 RepID=UPI000A400C21|nr:MFS transporter [Microbacterium gorillae]
MPVLVLGRLVQGLGAGGQTVGLYVVVARAYPGALHGRVFAAFSAAWVVPSLIGPFIAGVVAGALHWRWVFLGVAVLTVAAFAMVVGRLRTIGGPSEPASGAGVPTRIAVGVIVAVAATLLSMLGDWELPRPLLVTIAVGLVVVIVIAVRPLLPRGTLVLRPGVASVVATRALIAGGMLGAEIYIPYLLRDEYGFTPTMAGLGLTGGALMWSAASEVQGRVGDRLGNARTAVLGIGALTLSIALVAVVAVLAAPPWLVVVAWTIAGAGMGFVYPRLSVLGLAYSTPQTQGFVSSSLTIADSLGTAMVIAVFGLLTAFGGGFAAVFAFATVIAGLALIPGLRLGHAHETGEITAAPSSEENGAAG